MQVLAFGCGERFPRTWASGGAELSFMQGCLVLKMRGPLPMVGSQGPPRPSPHEPLDSCFQGHFLLDADTNKGTFTGLLLTPDFSPLGFS